MSSTGLIERVEAVRATIERAAERADRDPAEVEVLPVTKGHPPELIREVAEAGLERIGENRVPEAAAKLQTLGSRLGLRWHLIGHLQRNKAVHATEIFHEIESIDSLRLAHRLSRSVEAVDRERLEVLVQVNASGEPAKSGFGLIEALDHVAEICLLPGLRVTGLMTMAAFTSDEDVLRATFRSMRKLFDRCADEVPEFDPRQLSMGMSNDFEIAVEEGSTRVRLGTTIFGERPER